MKVKAILLIGILLILVGIIVGFFLLMRSIPSKTEKKSTNSIENISGIENSAVINHAEPAPAPSPFVEEKPLFSGDSEVFHVRDNVYKQDQAEAVCKAFDSELASLAQLKEAYKKGADWCSYGWSKQGMALYPTQPDTFKKLQKFPQRADECGNAGINGGVFTNPNLLFGVNCYGPKPLPKEGDVNEYELLNPLEIETEKIRATKDNIQIAPFSKKAWSFYKQDKNNVANNVANRVN